MAARTIRRRVEYEIAKRKGSRFIAAAWPLDDDTSGDATGSRREALVQQQVKLMLDDCRHKFPNACHHCYAYTTSDGREYCSDDGEPHGTAGKPILAAMQRAKLVDVCVVVSRIFGGTLLGTGGLIRAYGAAAQELIENTEIVDKVPMRVVYVQSSYAHVDLIKQSCARFLGEIIAQSYAVDAVFAIRLPLEHDAAFRDVLQSRSSGGVAFPEQEPPELITPEQ
ncbi:hypothetical protein Poli38472_002697 [Pythium oligandrum]|uniref:Impact N-terminal domain-containing protein n=1 Tax=Pythium oligandrum TaxID=41045 RepID=A0A8K1CHN5_PYTOL|nr:hypothetical protein Poli38472_002697 [Pythium oligandrum]|eukprot:TMW63756.1 hypothetical protein Poli38472_002697 [Pythium oligandrum]